MEVKKERMHSTVFELPLMVLMISSPMSSSLGSLHIKNSTT